MSAVLLSVSGFLKKALEKNKFILDFWGRAPAVKGLIFTGGEGPFPSERVLSLLSGSDLTVAADSGIHLAERFKRKVDYIIGDMDSAADAENILKGFPEDRIILHEKDKDYTDTELALAFLHEKGCKNIVLVGGGGGRPDHFIAVYSLFFRAVCPDLWIMKETECWKVEKKFFLDTEPGEVISIFPAAGKCRMKSSGLKWSLDRLEWSYGDTGISNIAVDKQISVEMSAGKLLLFRQI